MADYSGRYRTTKRQWARLIVMDGGTYCCRCGYWIEAGEPWDLGHNDITGEIRGPEHSKCNRSAGARKGNARRALTRGLKGYERYTRPLA